MGMLALIVWRLTATMADPDLWGYLSFGRLFWNHTGFPYHDVFSYTPVKKPWVYHEWLTGVLFYPIYDSLGATGLQGLKYILGLGTAALIFKTARIRGASTPASVIGLLLITPFFSFAYSPVRAQVFTNLLFVVTLYILEYSKQSKHTRYLWVFPPLFLLWANLHGGFLAGLGVMGLFAIGESARGQRVLPYWLVLAPTVLITLINPYGLQYWVYLKDALMMPRPDIDEWNSIFFALQNGEFSTNILMFIILVVLTLLMLLTSRNRVFSDILLLMTTALLAFQHVRHQSMFFLVMGCCGPLYFTEAWNLIRQTAARTVRRQKTIRAVVLIFFISLFIYSCSGFFVAQPFNLTLHNASAKEMADYNYPVGAVEFIRKNSLNGNILTEFSWGEYIIWNLPESRVAMDGRYETLYTDQAAREYFEFTKGNIGWRDYLYKYPHEMILFRPDSIVSHLLHAELRWSVIYADADCALFFRKKVP